MLNIFLRSAYSPCRSVSTHKLVSPRISLLRAAYLAIHSIPLAPRGINNHIHICRRKRGAPGRLFRDFYSSRAIELVFLVVHRKTSRRGRFFLSINHSVKGPSLFTHRAQSHTHVYHTHAHGQEKGHIGHISTSEHRLLKGQQPQGGSGSRHEVVQAQACRLGSCSVTARNAAIGSRRRPPPPPPPPPPSGTHPQGPLP